MARDLEMAIMGRIEEAEMPARCSFRSRSESARDGSKLSSKEPWSVADDIVSGKGCGAVA